MPVNYSPKSDKVERSWQIPAKTFFIGEYVAISGGPALVLNTIPCFKLSLCPKTGLHGISPDSPAGKLWLQAGHHEFGLHWQDPYHGLGGLGASSAQFIGAFLSIQFLNKNSASTDELINEFYKFAWDGTGLRPSGYDVLAQTAHDCVYINQKQAEQTIFAWPFPDLAFILLHTGKKLATHEHLHSTQLPSLINLEQIAQQAKDAFATANSSLIIECVNAYHQTLTQLNLVAAHSVAAIEALKKHQEIIAIKGCGALGADILLLLIPAKQLQSLTKKIRYEGWNIVASSENLYTKCALIENKPTKTLEILA